MAKRGDSTLFVCSPAIQSKQIVYAKETAIRNQWERQWFKIICALVILYIFVSSPYQQPAILSVSVSEQTRFVRLLKVQPNWNWATGSIRFTQCKNIFYEPQRTFKILVNIKTIASFRRLKQTVIFAMRDHFICLAEEWFFFLFRQKFGFVQAIFFSHFCSLKTLKWEKIKI